MSKFNVGDRVYYIGKEQPKLIGVLGTITHVNELKNVVLYDVYFGILGKFFLPENDLISRIFFNYKNLVDFELPKFRIIGGGFFTQNAKDLLSDRVDDYLYARRIMGVRSDKDLTLERTSMFKPKQIKPQVLPSKIIFNEPKGKTILLFGDKAPYQVFSATCEKGTTFKEFMGFAIAYYKYIHKDMNKEQLRQRIDTFYKTYEVTSIEDFMASIIIEHLLNNGYSFKQIDTLSNAILGVDVVGGKTSVTLKGQKIEIEYICSKEE